MRVSYGYASAQALILVAGFIDELIEDALVVVAVFVGQIPDHRLEQHGNQIKRNIIVIIVMPILKLMKRVAKLFYL